MVKGRKGKSKRKKKSKVKYNLEMPVLYATIKSITVISVESESGEMFKVQFCSLCSNAPGKGMNLSSPT